MTQQKIDEIYAWVCVDENGSQGIPGVQLGEMMMPLVGADMERIESFRNYAQSIALAKNSMIHLVKFSNKEILETFVPDSSFMSGGDI